jgi:pimeloyl-ACP methyl ester carboxylesterase
VPPNPLRSLPGDSETVADFLSTIAGSIVLVGHSYGGAVITNAATGNPNVKALVYVDAFAPAEGESIFELAGPNSALAADPTTVFDFVPYPGAPEGDVDLYLKQEVFLTSFANGVPHATALMLYATQRPLALSVGSQLSGPPAWETIPSWYMLGTQDLIIPPAQQRFMAERAGSQIVEVDAGHLSMIIRPHVAADLIITAARSTN